LKTADNELLYSIEEDGGGGGGRRWWWWWLTLVEFLLGSCGMSIRTSWKSHLRIGGKSINT